MVTSIPRGNASRNVCNTCNQCLFRHFLREHRITSTFDLFVYILDNLIILSINLSYHIVKLLSRLVKIQGLTNFGALWVKGLIKFQIIQRTNSFSCLLEF